MEIMLFLMMLMLMSFLKTSFVVGLVAASKDEEIRMRRKTRLTYFESGVW